MRVSRFEQAEIIAALWKLGGPEIPLPLAGGELDRMLYATAEALRPYVGQLTFSVGSVGLRCIELPDILLAGEEAGLFVTDGATFTRTSVVLSTEAARMIAVAAGHSTAEASRLGTAIRRPPECPPPDVPTP